METVLRIFLVFLFPIAWGYCLCSFLFRKINLNFLVRMSFAYGLGMGFLSLWMLILDFFYIRFSFESITFPLSALSLLWLRRREIHGECARNLEKQDGPHSLNRLISRFFIVLLIFYMVYEIIFVFCLALNIPIHTWDAICRVGIKAKVFFFDQSLEKIGDFSWAFYPIHTELCETWAAIILGSWNDQIVKILFPVTFLMNLIFYGHYLYRKTSVWGALTGLTLLLSANLYTFHATISYSDIFLAYYTSGALISILLWQESRKDAFLVIASLLGGMGALVKLEGLAYFFIFAALVVFLVFFSKRNSCKEKIKLSLKFLLPGLSIYGFFYFYKMIHKIPAIGRVFFDFEWRHLNRLSDIGTVFFNNLFLSGNWNIVWFILGLSLTNLTILRKHRDAQIILSALILFFIFYGSLALFTSNFHWLAGEQSYISLPRVFLHFFSFAPLLIVLLNFTPSELKDDI